MALRLGDEAPNFTAETTEGTVNFHEWLGGGWGIRTRRTSRRSARPSWVQWPRSQTSSRSAG